MTGSHVHLFTIQGSVIKSNGEWARVCGAGSEDLASSATNRFLEATACMGTVFVLMLLVWTVSFGIKRYQRRNYIRLQGDEVSALSRKRQRLC